ncbi:MAG TPA: tetratricopeptide repeat protein [Dehalococcoidia bacterium]|nr:tetratricopeptide repeat protein [Dehalococcoidia bacterium]
MIDPGEDKARLGRQMSQEAIALAMQGRWREAVAVNQSIIENLPTDVDAYNRLGKALTELGEFAQAKEAYSRALEFAPNNIIARKNLDRLSQLRETQAAVKDDRRKVPPHLFIGEVGKAGVVNLQNLAHQEILAKMAAGDQVYLKVRGQQLTVENERGEYLGQVELQHGFRLAKLIEGGNEYTAAIVSLGNDRAKVIIREAFQHPSQVGRLSFPVKAVEGFHPHVKDTLLRHGAVDEETLEEAEYPDLEEGELLPEGFSIFEGVAPEETTEDESMEEE